MDDTQDEKRETEKEITHTSEGVGLAERLVIVEARERATCVDGAESVCACVIVFAPYAPPPPPPPLPATGGGK